MRLIAVFWGVFCWVAPSLAQLPSAHWKTVEVSGYRIHYRAELEEWVLTAASKLEAIQKRVEREVGYKQSRTVDVLVFDPVARANGAAIPFLRSPRILLYASPPPADSLIGHYYDWPELLMIHEVTHLVHLARPSRNGFDRFLELLFPIGPIAMKSPRWLIEGYATVVEGRLTGAGRPHSNLRAAILRRWAQAGQLPSYEELSGNTRTWHGMSMAYLMGSAFLEWLERREGRQSLRDLWARMSARESRGFSGAFQGVFGESAKALYARFRAELTHSALEAERWLAPNVRVGRLWQRLEWTTGAPAVAPDGKKLALVLRYRKKPPRLVIWSSSRNQEFEQKRKTRIQRLLKRDPEDVAPKFPFPSPPKELASTQFLDGSGIYGPRWLPDGSGLLFARELMDSRGEIHPDLFIWKPGKGRPKRLTRLADLRDPDPAPDGRWAVAVRQRYGQSQLVRVDLASGQVEALTDPSVDLIFRTPRVSPGGDALAFVRHDSGGWRLVVRDLETSRETLALIPDGSSVSGPCWSPDGSILYAAVGQRGFINLHAFRARDGHHLGQLTQTVGAALSPEATPHGKALFFLSLEPRGFDLRRLDSVRPILASRTAPAPPTKLWPAVIPQSSLPPRPLTRKPVEPEWEYGAGRLEKRLLFGGGRSPSSKSLEVGLRLGDILGRRELLVMGAIPMEGGSISGAAAKLRWRGWAPEVGLDFFALREAPSRQGSSDAVLEEALDATMLGMEVGTVWRRKRRLGWSRLSSRLSLFRMVPKQGPRLWEVQGNLGFQYARRAPPRRWGLEYLLEGDLTAGQSDGNTFGIFRGHGQLGFRRGQTGVLISWSRGRLETENNAAMLQLQLGGSDSSILPSALLRQRILAPELPIGTGMGNSYEGQRLELSTALLPFPLILQRHGIWEKGEERDWIASIGTELRFQSGRVPLLKIPGLEFRVGLARILDKPFKDKTHWWVTTVWKP